jgi:uncharacterized cupredoxin-like copper-binding protein
MKMINNRLEKTGKDLSGVIHKESRLLRVLVALILPTLILPALIGNGLFVAWAQSDSRTFPDTGKTVRGKFLAYWDGHGGLAQQGFPISDEMQEVSPTDGKTYTVQYFERAVFELHPGNADSSSQPPNDVLLSLLGVFAYRQKYPDGAPGQTPNEETGSQLFAQTGKRVGGLFLDYWQSHGGLAQQGYPISDEFMEVSDLDGKMYTVQYFERAVFELHPENQPPYNVLLSQLGTFRYRAMYLQPAPTATAAATATSQATATVVVQPTPTDIPGAGPVTVVQVTLSFKHIDPTQITVPAGRTKFIVTNVDTQFGQTGHNFRIYANEQAVAAGTPLAGTTTFKPNESPQIFEINLAPGNYLTRCDVPGHAEAGMAGTLVVTPAP